MVLVGMGAPKETRGFLKRFELPFPMISDPDRKLYGAYGLKKMGVLGFLSPSLALKGLSAVAGGNLAGIPEGDVKQLAGAFVIDTSGAIRFQYLSADPSDIPPVEDLLAAIAAIA